jgi:hypothetical protein
MPPQRICQPMAIIVSFPRGVERVLQSKRIVIAALAASLSLSACATAPKAGDTIVTPAAPAGAPASGVSVSERDLTPEEKKLIMNALSSSLTNPGSAKYHWAKFPTVPETDQPAYCATVDGNSPHAAYNGRQAYIVDTKVTGGHITAAVLALIAGGKDAALVTAKCQEHGLDPYKSS